MASPQIDELGERLGIVLRDPEAIRQAFVHSSFLNENPGAAPGHNERLEFLGDAVIGQVVSRLLFDRFPRAVGRDGQTGHHLLHFPMAIAHSPIKRSVEEPSGATGRFFASILMTARSFVSSMPMSRAGYVVPSRSAT